MSSSAAIPAVSSRPQGRVAKLVMRPAFWAVVILSGFSVPVLNRVLRAPPPPLPVMGTLPAFLLIDQDGRSFGSGELAGKVWMAGFIFTRCPTICPAITATMAKVQARARGIDQEFRLVSFSVDPEFDRPAVMADYARRHRASPRLWKFLTGPLDAITATVVGGLKIAMKAPAAGESDFAGVFHGTHFVLVDRSARIRGYYDSTDPQVVDKVLADATMLLNRGD